jgi:hypothetical protein
MFGIYRRLKRNSSEVFQSRYLAINGGRDLEQCHVLCSSTMFFFEALFIISNFNSYKHNSLFTKNNHLYPLSTLKSEAAGISGRPTHFDQPTWHRVLEGSKLQVSSRFCILLFVVCNPLNIMSVFSMFFTMCLLPVPPSRLRALL